jgi:PAS domain S-box-containing protein
VPADGRGPGADAFGAAIVDRVSQPVLVVDHEGLIRFANPTALIALGFPDASDLLCENRHKAIHYRRPDGSDFPVGQCHLQLPRATGHTAHAEDWFVRRDGSLFPVEYWSAPVSMPGGRGTVVAFTDVSERRRTESALSEQDVILSAPGQPVLLVKHAGEITYVNRAAVAVLGFGDECELIGQNAHQLVHYKHPDGSPYPVGDCPAARVTDTGEPLDLAEDWWVRKDSSMIPVACAAVPIEAAGGFDCAIAFTDMTARLAAEQSARECEVAKAWAFTGYVRDITARRRAERELMASRARLVTAFDAARQRLTRDLHDGAQQRFVSTIISLQLAQQRWEADPGHARELLDVALDDARRGIDELREIAAGIHPVLLTRRGLGAALSALTSRLSFPVELQLPERRLPARIEESVYFFCSEALTNVVKHARASCASVRVAVAGGQCTVEVRDDGVGGAMARSDTSGLTGLRDRIGTLNGGMDIISPAAGDADARGAGSGGTVLRAWIPLPCGPGG